VTDTIEGAVTDRRAFAVRFSDLERWDVASFRSIAWRWPDGVLRPIGDVLRQKRHEVDPTLDLADVPIIAKISFGGEIFIRPPEQRRGYKGRLFWADPGDLIYSKIRVKQGSISVVPEAFHRIAVSPEYPVYEVDQQQLDGAYLELVVRSRSFLEYLDGLAHGGATKTRIPPELFQNVRVPVPPLASQRAILAVWTTAQAAAEAIRQRASDAEREAETEFIEALELTQPKWTGRPKALAVRWSDLGRWGVEYNQLINSSTDLTIGRYPVVHLGDCALLVQYGSSQKATSKGNGFPILRMNNILDGNVVVDDLKYVELTKTEYDSLRLQDGDILINRTNSKELVGKCAPFHLDGESVFASYLIRFRFDTKFVDPDYVSHVLNSFIGRQQIDALSRPIGGQANINSEELRSVQIPLPPLSVQSELISAVRASRERAQALRVRADEHLTSARSAVEAMILGTKPIPTT
jgi:type I restriction enzyme S subunit